MSLQTDTVRLVQLVEHQIVVLGVVGSSPTSHPKLERERFLQSFSFCFPWRGGLRFLHCPPLFWQLWPSLQAIFSFLAFVILAAGLSPFWLCDTRCRQCFLLFGICDTSCRQCLSPFWLCGIRYRRGPPMVRNMRAVLKKASCGTRRIFIRLRCKKQAFPVQKGYSVRRTAFCGTGQDSLNRKRVSPALLRN